MLSTVLVVLQLYQSDTKIISTFEILECGAGPLKPEVFQSIAYDSRFPASNVLILGEEDANLGNDKYNYWLAEGGKTTGQGFIIQVDNCRRRISGCQIKNLGKGIHTNWGVTRTFRVSGWKDKNGLWETLVEDELVDTSSGIAASLLNFTFAQPVEVQFLRFDLVSYWGTTGGGLQYFAAIPVTSECQHNNFVIVGSLKNNSTQLTAM